MDMADLEPLTVRILHVKGVFSDLATTMGHVLACRLLSDDKTLKNPDEDERTKQLCKEQQDYLAETFRSLMILNPLLPAENVAAAVVKIIQHMAELVEDTEIEEKPWTPES